MEKKISRESILIAVILALGLIIATVLISNTWRYVSRGNVTISVTGSSSKDIKSDYAVWSGSFETEAESLQDGYAKIKSDAQKIKEFFVSKGISEDKLNFTSVNNNPVYRLNKDGNTTDEIKGYRFSQEVAMESNDVDKIDKISKESSDLIMQDIRFNSGSPQFLYTKLSDLKVEMIGLASQDAKTRAEQIAKSTGNDIGEVRSSKMGVIQINAKNSTDVSDYGINDVSSIEKTIRAVVTVSFSLN